MIVTARVSLIALSLLIFVPSFCGPSPIPLKMDGKQILFLQVDEKFEDAVLPLIAAR